MKSKDDKFELYTLRVETIKGKMPFVCSHKEGEYFKVVGENIIFSKCKAFSMYTLASLLPLLPAKQRKTHRNDWMTTDDIIACPDPNCGGMFRIVRANRKTFRHSETTITDKK